jgi:hypothetical protein
VTRQLLRQKEAAMLLGVSVSWLRASSCPKVLIPGNGPKGRPIVRYDPADLEAWKETHRVKQAG